MDAWASVPAGRPTRSGRMPEQRLIKDFSPGDRGWGHAGRSRRAIGVLASWGPWNKQ